ncbi:MAG: DUF2061 domain-containing protein [Alphaproteobacteria bacterium]|nr:DUF2061 domain-containing protein [Alphaproteobacteria bacterium]
MESCTRSLVKAITWQLLGLCTTTVITFLFTGSLAEAAGLTVSLTLVALVMYVIHERIWQFVRWGRTEIANISAGLVQQENRQA